MTNFRGEVIRCENIARVRRVIRPPSTGEDDAVDFTDDEDFFNTLNNNCGVARVGASKGRHGATL